MEEFWRKVISWRSEKYPHRAVVVGHWLISEEPPSPYGVPAHRSLRETAKRCLADGYGVQGRPYYPQQVKELLIAGVVDAVYGLTGETREVESRLRLEREIKRWLAKHKAFED